MVAGSQGSGKSVSPPRRGKGSGAKPTGRGRAQLTKNLNTLYVEAERQARGGGSQVSATERGTGRRPVSGPSRRRRRRRRKVTQEREAEAEEAERQGEPSDAREDSDSLPPVDGSDTEGDGEAEEEGSEQEEDSRGVYLRGPVKLPNSFPPAERPLVAPHGSTLEKLEEHGRSVAHVLGGLLKRHYPGLVNRGETEAPAVRWSDYKLMSDQIHGDKYEAVLHDFWGFFRCAEGQEAECRTILERKGVKAVTDMIYEARIAAVVRIEEAIKKISCPRKVALTLFPAAAAYLTVRPRFCVNHVECWRQLAHMWDSPAWRQKNAEGHAKRALVKATHHQGSSTVSRYADRYAKKNNAPKPNSYQAFHMAKLAPATKAQPYDPNTPSSVYSKSTRKRKDEYDSGFTATRGPGVDPSSENIVPELVLTQCGGKKHGRPALGASSFPLETESLSSIRARQTSSSLPIKRRDEPARDLQAELEASNAKIAAMEAQNTALKENQRQMQTQFHAQMLAFMTAFQANNLVMPQMPLLQETPQTPLLQQTPQPPQMPPIGQMVIHSDVSGAGSNASAMYQSPAPSRGPTPPSEGH